jgi:hypothetical protein
MEITIQKCVKNGWPEEEAPTTIDDSLLTFSEGLIDDDVEKTTWQEWRLDGKIVKRGAHVTLKRNVAAEGIAAMFG